MFGFRQVLVNLAKGNLLEVGVVRNLLEAGVAIQTQVVQEVD